MAGRKIEWKRVAWTAAVVLANYGVDRLSKLWAVAEVAGRPARSYFGGLFVLVYAENDGAFLGMGGDWPFLLKAALLVVLPLAACAAGFAYAARPGVRAGAAAAIACLIGGGLGNLQDRLFNDFRVVDFLNFGIGGLRTGILNVADLSVTFGAIALALLSGTGGESADGADGGGKPGEKHAEGR